MFAQWPGDRLNFSIFKPLKFRFAGQRAASEAGYIANTNVIHNAAGQRSSDEEHWHFCLPLDPDRTSKASKRANLVFAQKLYL